MINLGQVENYSYVGQCIEKQNQLRKGSLVNKIIRSIEEDQLKQKKTDFQILLQHVKDKPLIECLQKYDGEGNRSPRQVAYNQMQKMVRNYKELQFGQQGNDSTIRCYSESTQKPSLFLPEMQNNSVIKEIIEESSPICRKTKQYERVNVQRIKHRDSNENKETKEIQRFSQKSQKQYEKSDNQLIKKISSKVRSDNERYTEGSQNSKVLNQTSKVYERVIRTNVIKEAARVNLQLEDQIETLRILNEGRLQQENKNFKNNQFQCQKEQFEMLNDRDLPSFKKRVPQNCSLTNYLLLSPIVREAQQIQDSRLKPHRLGQRQVEQVTPMEIIPQSISPLKIQKEAIQSFLQGINIKAQNALNYINESKVKIEKTIQQLNEEDNMQSTKIQNESHNQDNVSQLQQLDKKINLAEQIPDIQQHIPETYPLISDKQFPIPERYPNISDQQSPISHIQDKQLNSERQSHLSDNQSLVRERYPHIPNKQQHIPQISQYQHLPEISQNSHIPEIPQYSHIPKIPQYSHIPEIPQFSHISEIPQRSHIPGKYSHSSLNASPFLKQRNFSSVSHSHVSPTESMIQSSQLSPINYHLNKENQQISAMIKREIVIQRYADSLLQPNTKGNGSYHNVHQRYSKIQTSLSKSDLQNSILRTRTESNQSKKQNVSSNIRNSRFQKQTVQISPVRTQRVCQHKNKAEAYQIEQNILNDEPSPSQDQVESYIHKNKYKFPGFNWKKYSKESIQLTLIDNLSRGSEEIRLQCNKIEKDLQNELIKNKVNPKINSTPLPSEDQLLEINQTEESEFTDNEIANPNPIIEDADTDFYIKIRQIYGEKRLKTEKEIKQYEQNPYHTSKGLNLQG